MQAVIQRDARQVHFNDACIAGLVVEPEAGGHEHAHDGRQDARLAPLTVLAHPCHHLQHTCWARLHVLSGAKCSTA